MRALGGILVSFAALAAIAQPAFAQQEPEFESWLKVEVTASYTATSDYGTDNSLYDGMWTGTKQWTTTSIFHYVERDGGPPDSVRGALGTTDATYSWSSSIDQARETEPGRDPIPCNAPPTADSGERKLLGATGAAGMFDLGRGAALQEVTMRSPLMDVPPCFGAEWELLRDDGSPAYFKDRAPLDIPRGAFNLRSDREYSASYSYQLESGERASPDIHPVGGSEQASLSIIRMPEPKARRQITRWESQQPTAPQG